MKRFQKILFVSIGSKEDRVVIERANQLAVANQAQITLLKVLEDIPRPASLLMKEKRLVDFQKVSHDLARKELDELAQKIDSKVKVHTKIVFGKPFIEIIKKVQKGSYDILIKPKIPIRKSHSLDSTELHLFRKCPCPLWFIKPNQRKPFSKILIAVDPDPTEQDRFNLHVDLLKLGTSLAEIEQGKVEVVHIWNVYGESLMAGPFINMSEDEIDAIVKEEKKTHKAWLEDLLKPYSEKKLKVTMKKGLTGQTLVNMIEGKKPDIVVMGTVARVGLPGLLIGNTAEYVLGQIKCSIFAVKPKGFKTPVT
jgi:nucleotide-binding universal stress UspA family protein